VSFKEFDFIRQLKRPSAENLLLGIGDDAALIQSPKPWAISTDALAEGQHFLATDSPALIGQKTASVNLSDMAAMGCQPRFFLLNLHLSDEWANTERVAELMSGLQAQLERFKVTLIGGDTVRSKGGGLQLSGTILGTPFSEQAILRSGAQAGDLVCVTGALGGSFPHRHLSFTPRVEWCRQICERITPTAMMDLSDGLSQDIGHICDASGVGANIELSSLPIHADASAQHVIREDRLNSAMSDGEDFELLFCICPQDRERLPEDVPVTVIGCMTQDKDLLARNTASDPWSALERRGFSHDS
jgi:thiamine-monophosphate kinase